jgi:hypothetical protein
MRPSRNLYLHRSVMANESRYHMNIVRRHRIAEDKVLVRQHRVRKHAEDLRNKLSTGHDEIRQQTERLRTGKQRYEQDKRERLIRGGAHTDRRVSDDIRMREVETLFDLQSEQLLKLARCENLYVEPTVGKDKGALDRRWDEIIQPTEDLVATICRQLGQISTRLN